MKGTEKIDVERLRIWLTRGGAKRREAVLEVEDRLRRYYSPASETFRKDPSGAWGYTIGKTWIPWYTVRSALVMHQHALFVVRRARDAWLNELERVEALEKTAADRTYPGPLPTKHRPEEALRKARAAARLQVRITEAIYLVAVAYRDRAIRGAIGSIEAREVRIEPLPPMTGSSADYLRRLALASELEGIAAALRNGSIVGLEVSLAPGSDPVVKVLPLEPARFVALTLTAPAKAGT
jgi:hypothetical protein